jgi:hypothetical protein
MGDSAGINLETPESHHRVQDGSILLISDKTRSFINDREVDGLGTLINKNTGLIDLPIRTRLTATRLTAKAPTSILSEETSPNYIYLSFFDPFELVLFECCSTGIRLWTSF